MRGGESQKTFFAAPRIGGRVLIFSKIVYREPNIQKSKKTRHSRESGNPVAARLRGG
jgi:hypothetical protein